MTRNFFRIKGLKSSRQSKFELDAQLSTAQDHAIELLKGIRP